VPVENLVMKVAWVLVLLLLAVLGGCSEDRPQGPEASITYSPLQLIDGRIPLGRGPAQNWEVLLLKVYPEPVWLTGAKVVVENEDGTPADPNLIDLVNVNWVYPIEHGKRFYPNAVTSHSVFRLTSHLTQVELPKGFGIPLWSNEPLTATVRWQNTNLYQARTKVRLKLELTFLRDRIAPDLKAVDPLTLYAQAPLDGESTYGIPDRKTPELPTALEIPNSEPVVDAWQRKFTEEWQILPGQTSAEFDISAQRSIFPNSPVVLTTGYTFPSVEHLKLTVGDSQLDLDLGHPSNQQVVTVGAEGPLLLGVDYGPVRTKTRGLAHLLLYVTRAGFTSFPEMRQ
jgi:hypothetical protein